MRTPCERAPEADLLEPDRSALTGRRTLERGTLDCMRSRGAVVARSSRSPRRRLLFAGAAAKLTPAEQTWVAPLVKIWNVQNAGLHVVIAQAREANALVAGQKPEQPEP